MSRKESEPITVVDTINASSTETYEYTFPTDGVITGIEVATYVGQEFDLQYEFRVERQGEGQSYNLLRPLGKAFVAGNGENMRFNSRTQFEEDDVLVVTVTNEEPDYQYHANAKVSVDYRSVGGLLSAVGEVFN